MPALVPEQLTVGQIASRGRAVVGEERGRAAVRADVNRPRDQLLARPALAGDEHGEVVALHPLNLLDDARHRGAGGQEPGQQRFARLIEDVETADRRLALARRAERESLTGDRGDHAQPAHHGMADRPRRRDESEARTLAVAPQRLHHDHAAAVGVAAQRGSRESARGVRIASGRCDDAHVAARERRRRRWPHPPAPARSSAAAVSRPSRSGNAAASTSRRTIASSASAGEMTHSSGPDDREQRLRGPRVVEIASRAKLLEDAEGSAQVSLGNRARSGFGDEPSEREVAERRLIALAEQIEQRGTLREIVIRPGRAAAPWRALRRAGGGTRPTPRARRVGSSTFRRDRERAAARRVNGLRP